MQSTTKFFVVFLVAMLVASEVSEVSAAPAPEPRWKGWKKIVRFFIYITYFTLRKKTSKSVCTNNITTLCKLEISLLLYVKQLIPTYLSLSYRLKNNPQAKKANEDLRYESSNE